MPVIVKFYFPRSVGSYSGNVTYEMGVYDWKVSIGQETCGPYKSIVYCSPCGGDGTFPETPPGQSLTAYALLGDTIRLSYHVEVDGYTDDPYSGSGFLDWEGGDSIRMGFFLCVAKVPWILIHGWDAGWDKWNVFTEFLEDDRIPYATVDLRPDADPYTRAGRLAQEIDMIRVVRKWGDVKVNLVAHSQGGLDARAYLRNLGGKAKDQVYSLTMIATPNHGTVGASIRNIYGWVLGESTPWVTPGWVEKFNRVTPLVAGVKYYTIAGSKRVFPGSWLIPGEDDGVVPVKSVHLDGATSLGVFPREHNELVTDRSVYEAVKTEVDPSYSEELNALAFVTIEDGEVLPGQFVSGSVIVDDVNEVAFVLISAGPLGLALQSPSGEYVTPQSSNANISYDSGEWLDLLAQAYIVQKPAPGVWKAHVSTEAEPNHFMLVVSAENTFVLDGSTADYFNPVGGKVRLRAALDTAATITNVQADIIDPNGSREMVALYDDGLHDDDLPDDGLYGNAFFPSLEGEYTLVFSAEGAIGGREFSRADLESIFVGPQTVPAQ